MMALMRHLARHLRALQRREDGLAATEFAMILPVMLIIYIGSVEASTLIVLDRKVQSVAGSVGDLVARTERVLLESDLRDYFRAASGIMTPYSSSGMEQVVTAVAVDSAGGTSVIWSAKFENGVYSRTTQYGFGDDYPLPQEMIDVAKNAAGTETVIAAEASYSYAPLFGFVVEQPVTLYRSNFFLPRYEGTILPPS